MITRSYLMIGVVFIIKIFAMAMNHLIPKYFRMEILHFIMRLGIIILKFLSY